MTERYAVIAASGQLGQALQRIAPADVIAAAGIAGRREPLGLAIWRAAYANDPAAYREAQRLLVARVANVARRRHWPEPASTLKMLALRVCRWSVFSTCATCFGRGRIPIDGAPNFLSDAPCEDCGGRGQTPLDRVVKARFRERARDILDLWTAAHIQASQRLRHNLRR